jgi:hypothetical protein
LKWWRAAEVVKVEKTVVSGTPGISRITTSHIEKTKSHVADALPPNSPHKRFQQKD